MSVRNSLSRFVVTLGQCYRKKSEGAAHKKLTPLIGLTTIERFSYDLEMKTRKQNRNNKRTETERFDWFIKQIQTRVAFGWLANARVKKLSRNQPILLFDVILQHDWPIEQCLLHIRVFFGGKRRGHVLIFLSIG